MGKSLFSFEVLFDYKLREMGLRPDRMYWADRLGMKWGYFA